MWFYNNWFNQSLIGRYLGYVQVFVIVTMLGGMWIVGLVDETSYDLDDNNDSDGG